ncbi:MAG: DUF2244 domain-containing protein [Gammaproteobacteria bacterium]|nr:DUF2244 domain-containing protein [Gammaproteobacteria bacterium]
MFVEEMGSDECLAEFLIRPNRSMTAKGMIIFVGLVGLAIFLMALRFVLLGAWVVLPFAVLEIILLAAGFWMYERASRYRETVRVSRSNFYINKESVQGLKTSQFNPDWVQVVLQPDPGNWYPSRLLIRSHDKQVEIGACLTDQEREALTKALIKSISCT